MLIPLASVFWLGPDPIRTHGVPMDITRPTTVHAGPESDWRIRAWLQPGDQITVYERTTIKSPDSEIWPNAWLRVSANDIHGWISAHSVTLIRSRLLRLPKATVAPIVSRVDVIQQAKSTTAPNALDAFEVRVDDRLLVYGRSDDANWIAVHNPRFSRNDERPTWSMGWLPADHVVLDDSRSIVDLPKVLMTGLSVANVDGQESALQLDSRAFWDTWAWDQSSNSIWFNRSIPDDGETSRNQQTRLSRFDFSQQPGRPLRGDQVDYDFQGHVLPSPVGGAVLVRAFGVYDQPYDHAIVLQRDGTTRTLDRQRSFFATDGYIPYSYYATWSPGGRSVALDDTVSLSGERQLAVIGPDERTTVPGNLWTNSFHWTSERIYALHEGLVLRYFTTGEVDTEFHAVAADGFDVSTDGQYMLSWVHRPDRIATLMSGSGAFIRSFRYSEIPQFSNDGSFIHYALDDEIIIQQTTSGDRQAFGMLREQGHYWLSPDDTRLAYESRQGLRLADLRAHTRYGPVIIPRSRIADQRWAPRYRIGDLRWAPNSRYFAVELPSVRWPRLTLPADEPITEDGLARGWLHSQLRVYSADGVLVRAWRVHSGCEPLRWSPDSTMLAFGGPSGCA